MRGESRSYGADQCHPDLEDRRPLRGPYQPNQYGGTGILPFTILRRLDCILEVTIYAKTNATTLHFEVISEDADC
ncbi:N-6 DNA methylase [Mycolicibacterium neoaurum]|uniref:N-6 DNA methylase n=1 Tax=Mycolicibacterium neoaurum TaxID=1795 RepID=A0AAV2WG47_MYCNE|nr:N-6 DNA methylase [Mycolicibacterium neoaurum]